MPASRDLTTWVTAACLVAGVGSTPAQAAEVEVLAWTADERPLEAAETAMFVQRGFDPVSPVELRRMLERARAQEVQRLRGVLESTQRALAAAQTAYLEQRWDDMLAELEGVERSALEVLAMPEYCSTLWEVQFRRSLAHAGRGADGDEERARQRRRLAVSIDPEREPLRELYGPDVVQAHVEAMEAVRSEPARPIELDVEPDDAVVTVDCQRIDSADPQVVIPGLHVVHVVAPGRRPSAGIVDTRRREALSVGAPLRTDVAPAVAWGRSRAYGSYDPFSSSSIRILREAAAELDSTSIVIVERGERSVRAQAIGPDGVGRRIERPKSTSAIRSALVDFDDTGRIRVGTPRFEARVELGEGRVVVSRSVLRKPWFWGTLGAVAAVGLALGLGLGLGLRSQPSPGTIHILAPR